MRRHLALLALAGLVTAPLHSFAQSVFLKGKDKEEKVDLNDPFAKDAKIDEKKGVWKDKGVTYTNADGVEITRKTADIVRFEWKTEPTQLVEARDQIARGQHAKALPLVETVLRKFDPVKKTPGSLWLKAAEIKLDALSGLSNSTQLGAFIAVLEENDDGSVPGLAAKIKLAKLYQRVRAEDHSGVIIESDRLMTELEDPDAQARLLLYKADALLALRRNEEALNTYLRIPVFFGAEKSAMPAAYLGAAKALRALDTPATREQNLNIVSADYLRQIIREYPVSKEAAIAHSMLPREERLAEDKRLASQNDITATDGSTAAPKLETPKDAKTQVLETLQAEQDSLKDALKSDPKKK